jgi:hypothetical protein
MKTPVLVSAIILFISHCLAQPTSTSATLQLPPDFFPITTWEGSPQDQDMMAIPASGLESIRDCGFTVAAFVDARLLPECERLGIKAIVAQHRPGTKWATFTDEDITTFVKKMVDDSMDSPAVLGYLLMDEPGAKQFPALGKAVAAVHKFAPGKLAYVNLYPDYATINNASYSQLETSSYEEYLERYVEEVKPQFISYDNYRVLMSGDLKSTTATVSYYRNLMTVRRVAQKHGLPFWNIVSGNRIRPFTPVPSPANLLFQAYTTLAAGGAGVTWFTYYQHGYAYAAVDKKGNRTPTWSYLRMVNEQMKVVGPRIRQLKSTGVYFTDPIPAEGLPGLPGAVVKSAEADAPLMIGEFDGADQSKWCMIVNRSLEHSTHVKLTFTGTSPAPQQLSPVDGSLSALEQESAVWLTAGQGILIRVR